LEKLKNIINYHEQIGKFIYQCIVGYFSGSFLRSDNIRFSEKKIFPDKKDVAFRNLRSDKII